MDCSLPGSSVPGISQARILEWVAMPSSRGSSWPRNWTRVSYIAGGFFASWATREAHTDPMWSYSFPSLRIPSIPGWILSLHLQHWFSFALQTPVAMYSSTPLNKNFHWSPPSFPRSLLPHLPHPNVIGLKASESSFISAPPAPSHIQSIRRSHWSSLQNESWIQLVGAARSSSEPGHRHVLPGGMWEPFSWLFAAALASLQVILLPAAGGIFWKLNSDDVITCPKFIISGVPLHLGGSPNSFPGVW